VRETGPDECEVLNLAVEPVMRRRGAGRALVGAVLKLYPRNVYLEVAELNAPARSLYKSLGFSEIGRRLGYYEESGEAAIVMKCGS